MSNWETKTRRELENLVNLRMPGFKRYTELLHTGSRQNSVRDSSFYHDEDHLNLEVWKLSKRYNFQDNKKSHNHRKQPQNTNAKPVDNDKCKILKYIMIRQIL